MITFWSLLGAMFAVGVETTYKMLPAPWTNTGHFILWVAVQLALAFCVYKVVSTPGMSLIGSFIVWSCSICTLRVLVTLFIIHEPVSKGTWGALALLLCARVVQHFWK